jgi:hypothetical protein
MIPDHFMLNCEIAQFDNKNLMSPLSPISLKDSLGMKQSNIAHPMPAKLYCGGPYDTAEQSQNFPLSAGATTALNDGCDTSHLFMGRMMSTAYNAMVSTNQYGGGYSTS